MRDSAKIILAALNLPGEILSFLNTIPDLNCEIAQFNSPEGMVPFLKDKDSLVLIAVNADVLLNEGHNEIDKLIELFRIEPILGVNPVIACSQQGEDVEYITLERGFAGTFVNIPSNKKTAALRIKNLVSIYQTRYKIEMDFLKKQEDENRLKLLQLAEIDKETGIFNREAFSRRTEEMIRSNPEKKYILVRWDIDRFKIYNDTFGVKAGDDLLRAIGQAYIAKGFQSVTYGHWVSDHFVMCMEEQMFSGPAVQKYISEQLSFYRTDFEFIVRMGVYRITDTNLSVPLMCDRALLAMKSIKNDFEHRIAYYDDSMRGQLMEEQELITDIGVALQNHEFMIYFQPQYNYATGKMMGAEALVRWNHPVKGMLSPANFIPIFEQNGLICRLDEYIWEEVCKSIRQWIDNKFHVVPVSVNISRRDIYNPGLCNYLFGLTKKYDILPEFLRLEITESAYMEDPSQLIKVVDKLKQYGFTIEMDDFGSGYSSLNTLKDVPVDILKLDLKFLASSGTNNRGGSILTSIVRMASWLNLPVIAEGIEKLEQAEFLKSIGCYLMQGYLFSRPIPEDEFLVLMEASDLEMVEEDNISEDLANAVDFLNVKTQNALLFNSFVGGAAIVELCHGKLEAIRINDKFFDTIGITRDEYDRVEHGCLGRMAPKYEQVFRIMLDTSKMSGSEASCIIHYEALKPNLKRYWTRNRARYLATAGDSDIFYVAIDNISENMRLVNENTRMNMDLMTIMDNVTCGIMSAVFKNDEVSLAFANKSSLNMLGYNNLEELKEVFAHNFQAIYAPGEFQKMRINFLRYIREKKTSFAFRVKMEKKNGLKLLCFQQGAISYEDTGIRFTVIMFDMTQQIEGDINKFGNILTNVYDETFEIDYRKDTLRILNSHLHPTSKDSPALVMSEGLTSWIKKYVVEDDKKKLAKFMDMEYVKGIQANDKIPNLEYSILLNGKTEKVSSTWLQIEENTYLVCSKCLK